MYDLPMKKLLALLIVLFAVWLYLNRDRVYLHDFFAHMDVAGAADTTHSIYFNAANDLLLISSDPPALELVRPSGAAPVLAGSLNCIYGLACLAHKEDAAALAAIPTTPSSDVTKTSRTVTFKTAANKPATVRLW